MKTNFDRRKERGRLPLQLAMALAISSAVAVLAGAISSQPWAAAGEPLHGISFAKGCVAPTLVGDTYKCNFLISNSIDQGPDTLTITSIVDVVHASPSDVNSGNVLPTLSLGFSGGASCEAGQTSCTLPPGSSISTTAPLAFYTTDADDPSPLFDDAVLTWQDTCSSDSNNCPEGNQQITAGSQSPLYTNTPTSTPTTVPDTATPTNTPRATRTSTSREESTNTPRPANTNTPTAVVSVAPATVAPTQVPIGITLPPTGDGGDGGSSLLVGLLAGAGTLGLLLVMGRARNLRAPRQRNRP